MEDRVILLVDDEAGVREAYAETLRTAGYHVLTANGPHEALDVLKTRLIRLLISDIHMPGMNGFEFISTVKHQWPQVSIIMFSAKVTMATQAQSLQCGTLALLEKPVDAAVLLATVEKGLEAGRRYRRHRNVLVADDHRQTREFLKAVLDEAGYDVTIAGDGQEAVDQVKKSGTAFDIALIDLNMPRLPGPEAIVELRKLAPATLIILMTGEATSDRIQQAYHAGGFTLIRKPFDLQAFLAAFASYEYESDLLKSEVAERETRRRQPIHKKAWRWWRENVTHPEDPKQKAHVRFAIVIVLCIIISVSAFFTIDAMQRLMQSWGTKTEEALDYLKWDKDRKMRIDEEQKKRH